jgi:hypothetical protein
MDGCLSWAFEVSDFWPAKLVRGDQDPLVYFADKLEKIMPQYFGHAKAEANKLKQPAKAELPKASVVTPPAKSKLAFMRKNAEYQAAKERIVI